MLYGVIQKALLDIIDSDSKHAYACLMVENENPPMPYVTKDSSGITI